MNKLFILALLSLNNFPAQGMIRADTKISIDRDTALIAGIAVAASTLLYFGYKQYNKSCIRTANTRALNHNTTITEFANYYRQPQQLVLNTLNLNNPSVMYEQQKKFRADVTTTENIITELNAEKRSWNGYADYDHAGAQQVIQQATTILPNLKAARDEMNSSVADYELSNMVIKYQEHFQPLLVNVNFGPELDHEINYRFHDGSYPHIQCLDSVKVAQKELSTKESLVGRQTYNTIASSALRNELEALVKTIVNSVQYKEQCKQKKLDDAENEKRENEKRLVRAKEQEAHAALQQAEAKKREARAAEQLAQVKQQEVQIAREKQNQEALNNILEIAGIKEKPKPAQVNLHIHNN